MFKEIKKSKIPGCFELVPNVFSDNRGLFIKTFHANFFKEKKLKTDFKEEFYSVSTKNVMRGLHFQLPPKDLVKLVSCPFGEVMDVVVDLRKESPTYGRYEVFLLNDEKNNLVYIPEGLAHGFFVKSEKAIMIYKTTEMYSPEHDTGIHWSSFDIPWPTTKPIISERDSLFVKFKNFNSPFKK